MKNIKRTGIGVLAVIGLMYLSGWLYRTHDDFFSEDKLLEADASELKNTIITSHLEAPLTNDKNVLWCGTFQLAWNEILNLVGNDLHLSDEPVMLEVLNRKLFSKRDIDEKSYVAVAGFVKDGIHSQIQQQLAETFKGQATPHYLPPRELAPRPQDIVAYSYMFKNLEFEIPFERIDTPISFGAEKLACFGVGEELKRAQYEILEQVVILDYKSEDDFIIELKTKSINDRLILAKTKPGKTLHATIKAVRRRMIIPEPIQPVIGDILRVPKFNFDLTQQYRELENRKLLTTNPKIADDLVILSAIQNIRFQFDEKGVRLRSESEVSIGCSGPLEPPLEKHIMIFNKPFLLMLQRSKASKPYFAIWVSNTELLIKK